MKLDPEETVLEQHHRQFSQKEMFEDLQFLLDQLQKSERFHDEANIDFLRKKYLSV